MRRSGNAYLSRTARAGRARDGRRTRGAGLHGLRFHGLRFPGLASVCLAALLLASCDVHEYPKIPESVPLVIRLSYETDMTVWNHVYDVDTGAVTETGLGETYDNALDYGLMRYVVRAYPASGSRSSAQQSYRQETVFTRDISASYDCDVTLDLAPGDYTIMVWSDLVRREADERYYDPADFSEVTLQGDHEGGTDYRDAFRGDGAASILSDMNERAVDTLTVTMQRPLAKYEFVTTDLEKFLSQEQTRVASKAGERPDSGEQTDSDESVASVDIADYRAVFYYVGFMPSAYSLLTDKPADSSTGVYFGSRLDVLDSSEASVGFDYVFVNGGESSVTVQVALYDGGGTMLSLTDPINVPLMRSRHTVLRGEFLTVKASGGVYVDTDYDGNYNVYLP